MKIFKFGGASVKDANGVKNIAKVLKHEGVKDTLVVLSAMGKMTNAFENIVDAYYYNKPTISDTILTVKNFHLEIIKNLDFDVKNEIFIDFEPIPS